MKHFIFKFIIVVFLSLTFGVGSSLIGLFPHQSLAIAIFSLSVLGTLFFWEFRLSFAFLGTSILLISRTIDLESLVLFSSLEVILFLVGMMVLIGLLKEAGLFAWIVSLILRIRNLTAKKFLVSVSIISALLACAVDEVTSIIFIVAAVLEICDYFEVDPVPFIIGAIFTTNIGSSGTVLGNPIGILIAAKAGLSFEDFIIHAFPLMLACLFVVILLLMFWYRHTLKRFDGQIKELGANEMLIKLISVPPEKELRVCLGIFAATLFFIALHHRIELSLGLEPNTVLLVAPLISSGLVMIWKWRKARKFIERDVEWWTLIFFLLLFAQAGTLKYTGATDVFARKIVDFTGSNPRLLSSAILWMSAIGSSMLDNVVVVAAFIPIIQGFSIVSVNLKPLWWALLFGGCLGGNITLIGSTANIVALGILEKDRKIKIGFFKWIWIGLCAGILATLVAWLAFMFVPLYK